MKYPVYAYRDASFGFGSPIVEQNELTAVRGFKFAISGKDGIMNFSPQDFDLYRIGSYDNDKGEMIPEMPELVLTGIQALK